ncbi:SWI/SNF and RSC complex subunit Ssr3 [Cladophialophora chaetospira]|uniref:SWI/SNF and RSC complex subunit Ssr3 n=1 Tax=Cladophialophora chaetospira TaxID=386627 RepID=A0AA38XLD1_9EURO|nr:SWI/SNF and RSC complex subunit Ssr3 [Cladophialophora chaetospira]
MNPQMQSYRQFANPAQGRSPAARRPGECDSSTSTTSTHDPMNVNPDIYPSPGLQPFGGINYEDYRDYAHSLPPHLRRLVETGQTAPGTAFLTHYRESLYPGLHANSHLGQLPPAQHAAQQAQAQMMQQQAQQRNAAIEHQLAQRRARKPTDRNIPDGLEDVVIGDGVDQYRKLREAEKRLDHLMARKRLEIHDNFSKNVKRQKTMRIWISNTASGQPWQANPDEEGFTFDSGGDPTYRVKIQGRLLEYDDDDILHSDSEGEEDREKEDQDQEMTDDNPKSRPSKRHSLKEPSKKLTHFFKAMNVEFDNPKNLNTGPNGDPNQTVTWKKGANASQSGDFDTIEFERKADENVNITICLTRDEQPERFRLSKALAETLDMEEADRAEVVMGIWDYVRAMGLQEDEERRSIQCDDSLKRIFDTETFFFPQAAERLIPHLHPLPPVRLPYTIRVDQAFHATEPPAPTVYDVRVTTEDPLRPLLFRMTQNPEHGATLQQLRKLDDDLAVLMQAITHHKARHQFFTSMAKDPQKFISKWLSSQKRDLSVLLGELDRGDVAGMEFAGQEVWAAESVKEAVRYRLARAEAGGR